MKVKNLIEELKKFDQESEIMVSIDPGFKKYPLYRVQATEIHDIMNHKSEQTVIVMDGEPNNDFHEDQD